MCFFSTFKQTETDRQQHVKHSDNARHRDNYQTMKFDLLTTSNRSRYNTERRQRKTNKFNRSSWLVRFSFHLTQQSFLQCFHEYFSFCFILYILWRWIKYTIEFMTGCDSKQQMVENLTEISKMKIFWFKLAASWRIWTYSTKNTICHFNSTMKK